MPEVTAHLHGAPSWAELDTNDEAGALTFYSAIFGWADDPQPMTDTWTYHMQRLNGLEAAAIYKMSEEEAAQGIPPHWTTYFTADDVDAAAEKAPQLGGSVLFGPMDVFEFGRMVMLQDPQGATFAVWQPKQHIGCRIKHDPGAMTWNDLMTSDRNAAIGFYNGLLGIESSQGTGDMEYIMIKVGDTEVGGVMEITPDMGPVPPCWTVYFAVVNVDETVAKVQSLGGGVVVPATDIPDGARFAALTDPQGAYFSIYQGV